MSTSTHQFVQELAEKRGVMFLPSDEPGFSVTAPAELPALNIDKHGPCTIPGCAVCSGEMARRGK